ncbi:sensor histidine kinase [Massilia sp. DWR3-1-1]|uniref:sensor histidine kinase n=1 Tax=Massilia sp. DWR3-1-1 TaxID=2804559 RepID=UPI003CF344CD
MSSAPPWPHAANVTAALLAGFDRLPGAARYGAATVFFLLALASRFALAGVLPATGFPFLTFFPAVMISAFLVGLGPGLLAALLSVLAVATFFIDRPAGTLDFSRSDLIAMVFFAGVLVIDCWLIHLMKQALSKLRSTSARLRASEASLREAGQNKDVFLATLAHELRNPLAAIRSAAQLMQMAQVQPAQTARAAAVVERQSAQLARLVDDLLDVASIGSGKLDLQRTTGDLRQAVTVALETCGHWIGQGGQRLSVELPEHAVDACFDSSRIIQAIANLLHNAAKFTPPGGAIAVSLKVAEGVARITITDNGRGIAPESVAGMFAMFAQETPAGQRGSGNGLGIGLALTRRLIELHGGTLEAFSAGLGHGAEFSISLPLPA